MNDFVKLPESFLYQVDGSLEFVIVTDMRFHPVSRQTELKGKLYNYENEELTPKGEHIVFISGNEDAFWKIDEKGNPID